MSKLVKYYIAASTTSTVRVGPFRMLSAAESVLAMIQSHGPALMLSTTWNMYSAERRVQLQGIFRNVKDVDTLFIYGVHEDSEHPKRQIIKKV